ncbi:BTB/POZ domain-containing protein 6-B [Folsomia candida]|uniref:BTB/POZ domain-containing protein 6 n=1 Tax=Folsomia candida TaxID=158441 RepID=A0A226EWB9_FOLCA|nr:BTB/POZ domain-containing protein 6-B [Folsomia candida]OXA61892.1 BTB/POZ domain-containing protein 6 [Folsomia candida]
MFYGQCLLWKENSNDSSSIVMISDIHPSVFEVLIEYLYTGKLGMRISVSDSIELMYAASKYCVDDLVLHLISLISELITLDNVLTVLEAAILFNYAELKAKCWTCIECDTDHVFHTEKFVQLERNVLREIIQHEPLNVSEIDVYHAVVRWAIAHCETCNGDDDVEPNPEDLRKVIGEEILYLIRFPTMHPVIFSDGPASSGILSTTEINNIFLKKFSTKAPIASLFIATPRIRIETPLNCPCAQQANFCSFCSDHSSERKSKEINMFLSPNCYCRCRMRKYCPRRTISRYLQLQQNIL